MEPIRTRRTKVKFFQGWADQVDFTNKKITIEEAVEEGGHSTAYVEARDAGESKEHKQQRREVKAQKGQLFDLTYDKLIATVGCYSQTFGTPGVKEHACVFSPLIDGNGLISFSGCS